MKIIYEKHPVTPERKKELREQGYTIVDEVYRPEGAPKKVTAPDGESPKPSEGLTVAQLKKALGAKDIAFDPKASREDLAALLDGSAE